MRLSERIYQILLKAYPARYLRRYGEPMAQLFSDQLGRASGAGPFVSLWLRTLADLLRTVPARYFERLRRRGRFSLYNQAARRSVFFARYTATCLGHACITAEDILAGLLREDREIRGWLRPEALDEIRRAIGVAGKPIRKISVSGHMPLSETAKQILRSASYEAERTGTKQITPRHLAAAIVNQGQTLAADLLRRHGINLDRLRTE
jgi:hypothetical protein